MYIVHYIVHCTLSMYSTYTVYLDNESHGNLRVYM